MQNVLALYESKYGFTELVAKRLTLVLGSSRCCRVSEFRSDEYESFKVVVVCAPAYVERIPQSIADCAAENFEWMKKRKVFLISTCLAESMSKKYFKPLRELLGESIINEFWAGGRFVFQQLTETDKKLMEQFSSMSGFMLKDYTEFDAERFVNIAQQIKVIIDQPDKIVEGEELRTYIDDFLTKHNTCTLVTSYLENIRVTPVEYIYRCDSLYVLSEGGYKFLNLLFNRKTEICIYDEYKSMDSLAGMQLDGTADIVDIGSDEYVSVLEQRGLNYANMVKHKVVLNMIRIKISKIEFLWSGFSKLGYDVKQVLQIR